MPKNKHQTTILAIRPGRRKIGVAVLCGGELRYWGITRFRQRELDDLLAALDRRIVRLVRFYDPAVLAVEKPTSVRLNASPWLGEIVACVRSVARKSRLQMRTLDPVQVRGCLCGSNRANRRDLAQRVVQTYPHLSRYSNPASRWQNEYWMPMFQAVAIGMVCDDP